MKYSKYSGQKHRKLVSKLELKLEKWKKLQFVMCSNSKFWSLKKLEFDEKWDRSSTIKYCGGRKFLCRLCLSLFLVKKKILKGHHQKYTSFAFTRSSIDIFIFYLLLQIVMPHTSYNLWLLFTKNCGHTNLLYYYSSLQCFYERQ